MSEQSWSLVLLACELGGLASMFFIIGRRRLWWGWLIVAGLVATPWLVYSVVTWKIGFIVLSVTWLAVHLSNAYRWRKGTE